LWAAVVAFKEKTVLIRSAQGYWVASNFPSQGFSWRIVVEGATPKAWVCILQMDVWAFALF